MNKLLIPSIIFVIIFTIVFLNADNEKKEILIDDFMNILKIENYKEKYLLIDIREPFELKGRLGQIDGILNIPLGQLNSKKDIILKHNDKKIILICRSGNRTLTGVNILSNFGVNYVRSLKGGMIIYRQFLKKNPDFFNRKQ